MGTTSLVNILSTVLRFVSAGTISQMKLNESGTVVIKFDPKKYYVSTGGQHFPFKRPNNLQSDNSQSS